MEKTNVVHVPVEAVRVRGMRLRSEHNVASLAGSIEHEGLHYPIIVDEELHLIDGLHRLKAHELLRRRTIAAQVRDVSEIQALLTEVSTNLERHELSAIERAEHVALKDRLLRAQGLRKPSHRPRKAEIFSAFPGVEGNDPRELVGNREIAAQMNLTERALRYDREIVRNLPDPIRKMVKELPIGNIQRDLRELARLNILEQACVVSLLASGEAKNVRDARRSMERQGTRLLAESTPRPEAGPEPYRTIVVDPPWSGEDSGDVDPFGKVAPSYQTMTLAEISELPVGDLAKEEDCHLYLWVTGRMMPHGPKLMEAWGFRYIQPLHWIKNRIGTGRYFRNSAELVLFGIRGARYLAVNDQSNVFHGDRGRHSEKPEEFYELVRRCSPGPRLEMFARTAHDGFDAWGAEVGGPRKAARTGA